MNHTMTTILSIVKKREREREREGGGGGKLATGRTLHNFKPSLGNSRPFGKVSSPQKHYDYHLLFRYLKKLIAALKINGSYELRISFIFLKIFENSNFLKFFLYLNRIYII